MSKIKPEIKSGIKPGIKIDPYVIDTLMRDIVGHDRQPAAFLVYLYLWSRTHGMGETSTQVSHQGIADDTGLSKSAAQAWIRNLARRKLVRAVKRSKTSTPEYSVFRPWADRR